MSSDAFPFFASLIVAALAALVMVATTRWHVAWSADPPQSGPQKIHATPIPRIGGVAIALGFAMGVIEAKVATSYGDQIVSALPLLAALSIPFFAGLIEDVTKRFGAVPRLLATFIAAAIAYVCCGVTITRFDMPVLDSLLVAIPFAPLLLTMFCIGGVAHAFNLADGLNGLLAGLGLVACALIGAVAVQVGDVHVATLAASLAGATLGFMIFNFPRAKLFAGDSGAYVVGTMVALLCILLVARNTSVSPWLAFVAVLYPFIDTTFAIVRRAIQRRAIMQPDAEHLHSLLARSLREPLGALSNAGAALTIILTSFAFAFVAYAYRDIPAVAIGVCIAFATAYSMAWLLLSKHLNLADVPSVELGASSTSDA